MVSTRKQKALNLLSSLVLHDRVTTTEAKAKLLKRDVERLISRSKKLDLVSRRRVLGLFPRREAAEKLFERIIPQFKDRVGGYVRVVKLPPRRGDNAPMARVEFVEEIRERQVISDKEQEEEKKKAKVKGTTEKPVAKKSGAKKPARKTSAKNKSNKSKRS